jgi:hypothetical protein
MLPRKLTRSPSSRAPMSASSSNSSKNLPFLHQRVRDLRARAVLQACRPKEYDDIKVFLLDLPTMQGARFQNRARNATKHETTQLLLLKLRQTLHGSLRNEQCSGIVIRLPAVHAMFIAKSNGAQ